MDLKTFHCEMDSGHEVVAGSSVHLFMRLWRWMMWLSRFVMAIGQRYEITA